MKDGQKKSDDASAKVENQNELKGESTKAADPKVEIVKEMNDQFRRFDRTQDEVLALLERTIESAESFDQTVSKVRKDFEARINGELEGDEIIEAFENLVFVAGSNDDDIGSEEMSVALNAVVKNLPHEHRFAYFEALLRNLRRVPSDHLHMFPGFLTMLVSQVEVAIRGYTEAVTDKFPHMVIGSEDSIPMKDLDNFSTVDEVKRHVVQTKVDKVLRGSLQDWVNFFVDRMKIDAKKVTSSPEVIEVTQRRHCFIHNDGKASSLYLANTQSKNVELGEYLAVEPDYIRGSADLLYVFLFSLHCAVAGKLAEKNGEARDELGDFVASTSFYLLQDQRYEVLKLIDKSSLSLGIEKKDLNILKVNIWLAYKFSGDFDQVKVDIEALDSDDIPLNMRLAKAALLGDNEIAADLIDAMIVTKDIKKEHIITWPLLREVYPIYKKRQSRKTEVEPTEKGLTMGPIDL